MINPLWIRDDHLAHFSIPSHPAFKNYNIFIILKWNLSYTLIHLDSILSPYWNNHLGIWQDPDSHLLWPCQSIPTYFWYPLPPATCFMIVPSVIDLHLFSIIPSSNHECGTLFLCTLIWAVNITLCICRIRLLTWCFLIVLISRD